MYWLTHTSISNRPISLSKYKGYPTFRWNKSLVEISYERSIKTITWEKTALQSMERIQSEV